MTWVTTSGRMGCRGLARFFAQDRLADMILPVDRSVDRQVEHEGVGSDKGEHVS
jgi:hypothetical protein